MTDKGIQGDQGVAIANEDERASAGNTGTKELPDVTNNNEEMAGDVESELGFDTADESIEFEGDLEEEEDNIGRILRDRSTLRKPEKFKDYVLNMEAEEYSEPEFYKEAVTCKDKELWIKAMENETNSLEENGTWVLEKLPNNRKAIPCKWVYRVKLNADGSVDKYKARLVVKGFRQKKGIDYEQTFSPVARMATVRAVLSIAASEGMKMLQFDVSTAFLYGSLDDEEIFMKQPEGYDDGTGRVCLLKKSLYGLKQAPRCWNKRILDFLKEVGFEVNEADPCLFKREKADRKLILALYVDDGLLAGSDQQLIDEFIDELKERFKITTKPASYFLGIEIETREGNLD